MSEERFKRAAGSAQQTPRDPLAIGRRLIAAAFGRKQVRASTFREILVDYGSVGDLMSSALFEKVWLGGNKVCSTCNAGSWKLHVERREAFEGKPPQGASL